MSDGTVLLIEDNTIQRMDLAATLHRSGFHVLSATDGNEALNRLCNRPVPDIIVLDMLIPAGHGDGWWFLEQRKRISALTCVPVIITTALPSACAEWAASLGAAGLISKPFDATALLAEVRRCLADRDGKGV